MCAETQDIASSASQQLRTIISKLHPISRLEAATTADNTRPFAPRFCGSFYRPSPSVFYELLHAVSSYSGATRWQVFGSPVSFCITAFDYPGGTPYPPNIDLEHPESVPPATPDAVHKALLDVPNLCAHMEAVLSLNREQRTLQHGQTESSLPAMAESDLADFVEPGMHVTWLVAHPTEFDVTQPRSPSDRLLHFALTQEEWNAYWSEIRERPALLNSIHLMTRIAEFYDVQFEAEEVGTLFDEVNQVRSEIRNAMALSGMDKLALICKWAKRVHLGIYLLAE